MSNYSALREGLHKLEISNVQKLFNSNLQMSTNEVNYLKIYLENLTKQLAVKFSDDVFQLDELISAMQIILVNANITSDEKDYVQRSIIEANALKATIRTFELQNRCSNNSDIENALLSLYAKKETFTCYIVETLNNVLSRESCMLISITVLSKGFVINTDIQM